mgnify:FL=1
MYRQKGLSGDLLTQVVDLFMADDNRLLKVMLEDELGLTLEAYEHPLKQAMGAGVGVLIAAIIGSIGLYFGFFIPPLLVLFSVATLIVAKHEGNAMIKTLIWNLGIVALALFSIKILLGV